MKSIKHRLCRAPQLLLIAGTVIAPLFMVAEASGAIINTQNAKIRVLLTDGFGNTLRNYVADGNDPVLGGATLDLNAGGVNSVPLGIFPASTTWNLSTVAAGDGAATVGGLTAGFNPNFFGFALTQIVAVGQFDDADANAKAAAARMRVDFSADFQNNAVPIPAAGVLGIFLNFFSVLPAVGDFAEGKVSLTMSGYGGANLTVNSLAGGDGVPTAGFYQHTNPPHPGLFITDISNSVVFPGVNANALVTLQASIDIRVDPGSVEFEDTNPNPLPEPSTITLLVFGVVVLLTRRRRA